MKAVGPTVEHGQEFAGYRLERLLGSGSYGMVYLAEEINPQLQRKVALKILRPGLASDAAFRERFFRESRLVARLEPHPAIVAVYDAGEENGQLWMASRFVDGMDLRTVLEQRGRLSLERTAMVIGQIGDALDAAHRDGIIHRDVKPGNILVSHDLERAFLADFGLSKKLSHNADNSLTRAGEFLGTVLYAAPEQLGGGEVSGRSDQYALGCVAFETLAGRPPFEGGIETVIMAHINRPLPDVTAFDHQLPAAVNGIIQKATAKRPQDRYTSCTEFTVALYKAMGRGEATVVPGLGAPGAVALPPPQGGPSAGGLTAPSVPAAPDPSAVAAQQSAPPPPPPSPVESSPPTPPVAVAPLAPSGSGTKKTVALVGGSILLLALILGIVAAWRMAAPQTDVAEDEGRQESIAERLAQDADDDVGEDLSEAETSEEALRAHVPEEIEQSCEAIELGYSGEHAALSCLPADPLVDIVFYVGFDTNANMNSAYGSDVDRLGLTPDTEGECPQEGPWDIDGTVHGRVACAFDEDDDAMLVWTDDRVQIMTVAWDLERDGPALVEWWADGGGGPLVD